jgi:hypothetical protein
MDKKRKKDHLKGVNYRKLPYTMNGGTDYRMFKGTIAQEQTYQMTVLEILTWSHFDTKNICWSWKDVWGGVGSWIMFHF